MSTTGDPQLLQLYSLALSRAAAERHLSASEAGRLGTELQLIVEELGGYRDALRRLESAQQGLVGSKFQSAQVLLTEERRQDGYTRGTEMLADAARQLKDAQARHTDALVAAAQVPAERRAAAARHAAREEACVALQNARLALAQALMASYEDNRLSAEEQSRLQKLEREVAERQRRLEELEAGPGAPRPSAGPRSAIGAPGRLLRARPPHP